MLPASVKYADFLAKASKADIAIAGTKGAYGAHLPCARVEADAMRADLAAASNTTTSFSLAWVNELRSTPHFQQWDRSTDPVLFDIWEPAHPTPDTNLVADVGLRLKEGMQDLHLEKNLGPTRDALTSAFTAGSTSFLRAFDQVRSSVSQQIATTGASAAATEPATTTAPAKAASDAERPTLLGGFQPPSFDFTRRFWSKSSASSPSSPSAATGATSSSPKSG